MITARTVPKLKKTKVCVILARYLVPMDYERPKNSAGCPVGSEIDYGPHVEYTLNEQEAEEHEICLPGVCDEGFSLVRS